MDNTLFEKYGIHKYTMLEHSLKYASYGMAVFPLEAQGKNPITIHGFKDATTDPETIREMWSKYPFSNIGMATGSASGNILAIDIDVDYEHGKDGYESLREWEREHGTLPDTAMTITGRGGNHYLYHCTESRSRVGCLQDIDVRGDGGYIVLPPSIHPNGMQYEWEYDLEDYGISEADKSVIDLMHNGVVAGTEFKVPDVIPDGKRNDTLYKMACSMQAKGYSDETISIAVKNENKAKCTPPIPDDEMVKLIGSALSKQKGDMIRDTKPDSKEESEKEKYTPLESYTMSDLLDMDLKAPEFLIDSILPKGVFMLGAPPKAGKSWMSLDMAIQLATGGEFLGHSCRKCGVLYLALEDSLYRLKERTLKLLEGGSVPDSLHFVISSDTITPKSTEKGLYKQIEEFLDSHSDVELVIIDTLQMVTPSKARGEDAYSSTYTLLNSIRPFWQERQIGFLLVHHTRKRSINDIDPFETFLGSQALSGATDGMYVIQSEKDTDYSTFLGRGRDFEDVLLSIKRDEDTCRWVALGTPSEMRNIKSRQAYENSPLVKEIRRMVSEAPNNTCEFRSKDLREDIMNKYHETIGTSEKNFGTKLRELENQLLVNDGIRLERLGATTRNKVTGTYFKVSK